MLSKLLITLAVVLAPTSLLAQKEVSPPPTTPVTKTASEELEVIISEAGNLDDKLAVIKVTAKSAALISLSDPGRSELMFRAIWKFAKQQADPAFDKEQALTLILNQIFSRNPKLARQLLGEEPKPDESSIELRATGNDRGIHRTAKLASQLVDDNPRAASELLERSLSTGMTASGLNALLRLREKDSLLADFVVGKSLDGLRGQPDVVALSGLHLLSAYTFPEGNTGDINSSLQSLQIQYFSTTYDVLRASLAQTEANLVKDHHYSPKDLRLRALYQARMALTLAALAPRYQPMLSGELNALANKLGPQLPANVAQLAKFSNARLAGEVVADNPEMAVPLAIQSGDFEEARRLIDGLKSEELKDLYSQILAKVETKALLARADVLAALIQIRKLEDQNARLVLYVEAIKAAEKKHDGALSRLIVNEARLVIPPVNRNGLHVRALLAFASQLSALSSTDEALNFLDAAVIALNSLPKASEEPGVKKSPMDNAWAEINDPVSFLELAEFSQAFAALGLVDLDRTIIEARKIQLKSLQLVARLEAVGGVLRVDARKPKSKPVGKTVVLPPGH